MERTDLPALADFLAVATFKGLSAASKATGIPKATISRRVSALETSLGVRLLERGARKLRLTEDGQALVDRAGSLLAAIDEVSAEISGRSGQPRGLLRVSVPVLFARTRLGAFAARFLALYPEVTLDIDVSDRMVDLTADGFDVVVRANPAPDLGLVGKCFLRSDMILAAHPAIAIPREEDAEVACIILASASRHDRWKFLTEAGERCIRPRQVMRCSSMMIAHEAAREGAGAALMPRWLIKDDLEAGRLVSWGIVPHRQIEAWALHTSSRLTSPKVKAFMDALLAEYRDEQASTKEDGSPRRPLLRFS